MYQIYRNTCTKYSKHMYQIYRNTCTKYTETHVPNIQKIMYQIFKNTCTKYAKTHAPNIIYICMYHTNICMCVIKWKVNKVTCNEETLDTRKMQYYASVAYHYLGRYLQCLNCHLNS